MIIHTRETYADFLECEWWKRLSRAKRNHVGKCEECGSRNLLQSHHKRYPINLFDTTFDDLKVLCRPCHEKEHQIVPVNGEMEIADDKIPAHAFSPTPPPMPSRPRHRSKKKARKFRRMLAQRKRMSRNKHRKLGLEYVSRWRRKVSTGEWSC